MRHVGTQHAHPRPRRAMADVEPVGGALHLGGEGVVVQHRLEQRQARTPVDLGQGDLLAVDGDDQVLGLVIADLDLMGRLVDQHGPVGALAGVAVLFGDDLVHGHSRGDQDLHLLRRRRQAVEAFGELVLDVAGRQLTGLEAFLIHDGRQEGHIVAQPRQMGVLQRAGHAAHGVLARLAPGAQLGDHGIVEHADLVALADARVIADRIVALIALFRLLIAHQTTDRRQEAAIGVFGVDAALDGPAVDRQVVLPDRQLLAPGRADHLLDQIDAGDQLRHRMLDLQTGVHLQEVEALVLTGDELDRARRVIVHRLGQGDGLRPHGGAGRLVQQGRRRLLDDLLVAALDRAFALEQVDDVAVLVAQHLNLDVARVDDELLEEDAVVAEGVQRLGLHGGEALGHVVVRMGDADALAPAPGRSLDHDRIADLARDLHRLVRRFDQAHVARHGRDARLGGELLGRDLVAHGVDRLGVRPDEGDALGLQTTRKPGVFRQEAEAGVHGLRPRLLHGVHDLVLDQIGLGGGRRADVNRLIRHLARQ